MDWFWNHSDVILSWLTAVGVVVMALVRLGEWKRQIETPPLDLPRPKQDVLDQLRLDLMNRVVDAEAKLKSEMHERLRAKAYRSDHDVVVARVGRMEEDMERVRDALHALRGEMHKLLVDMARRRGRDDVNEE